MSHSSVPIKTRGLLAAILERQRWFRVLWWIAIMVVVVGSLLPERELGKVMAFLPDISDKVQHFGAYLGLAVLAVLGHQRLKAGVSLALCMILLGIGLEFAQAWSPGRTPDVFDALANACGVYCGLGFIVPIKLAARNSANK
jgi:VanZ family protein